MDQQTFTFWHELSDAQQHRVVQQFGSLESWLQMSRLRPSSIAIAWDADDPCGLSIISHDRIRVGAALVDVATLRYSTLSSNQSDELMVELLMHQAIALLAEGIGIVLVKGDVTFWTSFGFAPISYDIEARWSHSITLRIPEPSTIRIAPLTADVAELVRGISMTHMSTAVEFVDVAVVDTSDWLQLYGRDGQLRAAAQLSTAPDGRMIVARAAATNDGAAYDLVSALLANAVDVRQLGIRLSYDHPVMRMALEHGAVVRVTTASAHTVLAGVIDLPLMLEALKPAFRQRLQASPYATWNGGVRVEISDERAMIMCENSNVTIIDGTREASLRIKQVEVAALAQMAFGYRSIGALRRAGMLFCDDTELALCEVLFARTASTLAI